MLVGYCVTIALMVLYGFLCWRDNKKKDIQEAEWQRSMQGVDPRRRRGMAGFDRQEGEQTVLTKLTL